MLTFPILINSPLMIVSILDLIPAPNISVLALNCDNTKCNCRSLDNFEDAYRAVKMLSVYPWAWRDNKRRRAVKQVH